MKSVMLPSSKSAPLRADTAAGAVAPVERPSTAHLAAEARAIAETMTGKGAGLRHPLRATWCYRSFVVAASIAFVALPYLELWIDEPGRDDSSVIALYVLVTGVFWALGWIGWASVAATNARSLTSHGVSPVLAPAAFVVSIGIGAIPWLAGRTDDLALVVAAVSIAVFVQVWVWNSYRHTAALVGADSSQWGRMMWLPFLEAPLVAILNRLIAIGKPATRVAGFVSYGLLAAFHLWTYVRAMTAWDRALARRAQQPGG